MSAPCPGSGLARRGGGWRVALLGCVLAWGWASGLGWAAGEGAGDAALPEVAANAPAAGWTRGHEADVRAAAVSSVLTSLVVAILTYTLALGHAFGVLYFGPWTRRVLRFSLSTLTCVSPMVFLLVIYAARNDVGLWIVVFLAISIYPLVARLLLDRVFDAAADFHFLQARILGHGPFGVFRHYAWPRFLPLTLPFFFLGFIYSLLLESMFSSLGLLTLPHGDTWGRLIFRGLDDMLDDPWAVFAPGAAIMATILVAYACIPVFDRLLSLPDELG